MGAGCSVSPEAGDLATFIKLVWAAMLVPIVMPIALYCRPDDRKERHGTRSLPGFPLFLVGYVGLFVLNNVVEIPPIMTDGLSQLATGLLLLPVTALGVRTSLREVTSIGWRPMCLLAGETVLLAAIILGFLLLNGA